MYLSVAAVMVLMFGIGLKLTLREPKHTGGFEDKTLSISKYAPKGKAYACPKCGKALRPEKRNWDILHCFTCNISYDLWKMDGKDLALMDAPKRKTEGSTSVPLTKKDLEDILHHIWDSRHTSDEETELTHKLKLALDKFE